MKTFDRPVRVSSLSRLDLVDDPGNIVYHRVLLPLIQLVDVHAGRVEWNVAISVTRPI